VRRILLAVLGFVLQCVLYAVLWAVIGAVMFLPFGLIGWFAGEGFEVILFASGFGAFVCALLGIGQVFIERFSEKPSEPEASAASTFAQFYLGPLLPSWLAFFDVAKWFVTRDPSKQRPGRWRRAFWGACALGLLALLPLVVVASTSQPRDPDDIPGWALGLMIVGPAALIGAAIGALSDSL
jgi:hypothetical protein